MNKSYNGREFKCLSVIGPGAKTLKSKAQAQPTPVLFFFWVKMDERQGRWKVILSDRREPDAGEGVTVRTHNESISSEPADQGHSASTLPPGGWGQVPHLPSPWQVPLRPWAISVTRAPGCFENE